MRRVFVLLSLAAFVSLITASESGAITKKARDLNFMTFYAGTSLPVGEYNGIPGDNFIFDGTLYKFDGDKLYDDALYLGLDYGRMMGRWAFSVGFRYINHQVKDTIENDYIAFAYNPPIKMNDYDLGAELRYHLTDIQQEIFSPFVGVDIFSGFTTVGNDLSDNENRVTVALGGVFGAEFKIMKSPTNNNFLTLVSTNSYTLAASDHRPKYLHIGGALRYYFND